MGLTSCFSCFKSPKGEKQHEVRNGSHAVHDMAELLSFILQTTYVNLVLQGLNASKNSAQGTNTSHLHHEKPASSVAHGHGNVSNADTDHHAVLSKTSQACSSVYYSAAGSFISRSNSIDRTLHSNSIELIPADQQAGGAGGAYRISLSSVPIQPGSPVSATASAVQQQPAGTDEESGKEQAVQVAPPIDLALLQNPTELYKWHPLQACKACWGCARMVASLSTSLSFSNWPCMCICGARFSHATTHMTRAVSIAATTGCNHSSKQPTSSPCDLCCVCACRLLLNTADQ